MSTATLTVKGTPVKNFKNHESMKGKQHHKKPYEQRNKFSVSLPEQKRLPLREYLAIIWEYTPTNAEIEEYAKRRVYEFLEYENIAMQKRDILVTLTTVDDNGVCIMRSLRAKVREPIPITEEELNKLPKDSDGNSVLGMSAYTPAMLPPHTRKLQAELSGRIETYEREYPDHVWITDEKIQTLAKQLAAVYQRCHKLLRAAIDDTTNVI